MDSASPRNDGFAMIMVFCDFRGKVKSAINLVFGACNKLSNLKSSKRLKAKQKFKAKI